MKKKMSWKMKLKIMKRMKDDEEDDEDDDDDEVRRG